MKNELNQLYLQIVKETDEYLAESATRNEMAWRLKKEDPDEIRSPFALDRDRILYSGAYRRYHGKTQVFSFTNLIDEEMTNRNLHTTYVSQIARTIGKFLHLNLELIEAIALGHDLGHTPFGHDGERALSNCCRKYGVGAFHHNIESLHIVDNISRRGRGLNLTFQTRDGIISHDGEVHNTQLKPQIDKSEYDIQHYIDKKTRNESVHWMPATMEGCVVRITDTIAYIGQDIEDAIRFKILTRDELPLDCVNYLGDSNSSIINTLVRSVIVNSKGKDYIAFDEETSHYLHELKKFNYERIYTNEEVKQSSEIISRTMELLFEKYMKDIEVNNMNSNIFKHFLNHKDEDYLDSFNQAEKVRDFIATMTDFYYNEEIREYLLPWKNTGRL